MLLKGFNQFNPEIFPNDVLIVIEDYIAAKARLAVRKIHHMDPYHMAVALEGLTNAFLFCWLEDPEQHPYGANVPVIRDMFLKGVLNK